MKVELRATPFDPLLELGCHQAGLDERLSGRYGATAIFVGTMRDFNDGDAVQEMTLEHYPGMTETALQEIEAEANRRWPLEATLIVHRYGRMEPGERIVLVAVGSPHREAAFEACEFLVDWLKTMAPFWKLEDTPKGEQWVGAHQDDDAAAARWEKK